MSYTVRATLSIPECASTLSRISIEYCPACYGLPAGAVGEAVEASSSNLSFHLKELQHAGLIQSRRASRSIIYSAAYPALSGLVQFLMRDCCQGHPEVCAPAVAALATCCPEEIAHG